MFYPHKRAQPYSQSHCRTTPIFTVSSVTGRDLDLLKQFLNVIPPRQSQEEQEKLMQEEPEYLVG